MKTFVAYSIGCDGLLRKHDHLGESELDAWMEWAYGKFGSVQIDCDNGVSIRYSDNGIKWEKAK